MRIEYVGSKPTKTDNVAGTGLVWAGKGDVQDVPDDAAPKLLRHPDVWAEAAPAQQASQPARDEEPPLRWVLDPVSDEAGPVVLDAMSDDEVREFATSIGLKVDGRRKGDSLRQNVYDQVKNATGDADGEDESAGGDGQPATE